VFPCAHRGTPAFGRPARVCCAVGIAAALYVRSAVVLTAVFLPAVRHLCMVEPAVWLEVVAAVAAAVASAIGVIVGFGSALLLAPLLLLIYPAPQVAATLTSLGVITATLSYLADLKDPKRPQIYRVPLLWMLAGAAAATLPGVYLVRIVPQRGAQILLGVISLAAVVMLSREAKERRRMPDVAAGVAGAASQVAASITGVGGPPLMLHLLLSGWDLRRGRMTYGVFFIAANVMIAATLILSATAMPLWPVVVCGGVATLASLRSRIRIGDLVLRRALIVMTGVSGVVVLLRGLL
jgi:uncharacterized protein